MKPNDLSLNITNSDHDSRLLCENTRAYLVEPLGLTRTGRDTRYSGNWIEVRGPHRIDTMQKKIILDLDGVIVDFLKGACLWWEKDFFYNVPGNENNWDVAGILGVPPKEFWDSFNNHRFWANLEWMPDGKEILKLCIQAVGVQNIAICTAIPDSCPMGLSGKMEWVKKNIPELYKQTFIGHAKYFFGNPNTILVDDYNKNYGEFLAHDGNAILVPRYQNANNALRGKTVEYVREQLDRSVKR